MTKHIAITMQPYRLLLQRHPKGAPRQRVRSLRDRMVRWVLLGARESVRGQRSEFATGFLSPSGDKLTVERFIATNPPPLGLLARVHVAAQDAIEKGKL